MPEIYSASAKQANPTSQAKKSQPQSQQILKDIQSELVKIQTGVLSGFKTFPTKVKFETQEDQEKIILLLRRHFITNVSWIVTSFIMVLAPFIAPYLGILSFLPTRFQLVTFMFWYLFVIAYILENFLSWYFNVYIITDERVVDVDFYSLVYKRISDCKIDKIEDVTFTQGGLLQSVFNYGWINIQTAAEITEFEFEAVPRPAQVVKVLNQLLVQEEQEKIEGRVR
ncbi:PH domain-containing protein [Candidatus Beckwithbacteria bacterium]|nr:PH domain-containing protein [Candidatus Beckwithbacteria bacterium]